MRLQLVAAVGTLLNVLFNVSPAFWLERSIQVIVEQPEKCFALFRSHCT
jgi:hypothetical protein